MGGVRKRAGSSPRREDHSERSARALRSFLSSRGVAPSKPDGETGAEDLVRRIARGPVPPGYLFALAADAGAPFAALIEEASIAARREDNGVEGGRRSPAGVPSAPIETVFERLFSVLGEERAGQLEMARAVDRALRGDMIALIEAGTGTGKSLGYLVPAALYARETGERVVVSTYTKNLQDQLFRKEISLLEKVLPRVRAERLLGRENYLCPRAIVSRAASLVGESPEAALAFALRYALSDGLEEERRPFDQSGSRAWPVSAPARCRIGACAFADRCPLARARRRAREAEILFVNHALLLTDYRQGGGVIGPYSRVVFDEAHHLERCAMENLSIKIGRGDCRRILESLRPALRNEDAWKLLARELDGSSPRGAMRYRDEVAGGMLELERSNAAVFRAVEETLNSEGALRGTKIRYTDGGETFALSRESISDILNRINAMNALLKPIHDTKISGDLEIFRQEVSFVLEELAALAEGFRYLTGGCGEESVFWLDWGSDASLREICGSPLEVDRQFADYIESFMGSAVLTSATLSHGGSFELVRERLGLALVPAKRVEMVVPSPFPFDERCLVLIASGLGDPNGEAFAARVGGIIASLAEEVSRRLMALFPSYRLCHAVARFLERSGCAGAVLVQGAGESREALAARFRRNDRALLLGVASFWEGIDFPGEELEVLVIPKVPFPVPTEPVVEARSHRLAALGEDPFEKLFLPEAILRMRQGAGRLIRRMDDRGVIVILDERLQTRPYGPAILASLPSRRIEHVPASECAAAAARWFEAK